MDGAIKGIKKGARPALGRGLSALISAPPVSVISSAEPANTRDFPSATEPDSDPRSGQVKFVKISVLQANATQPRQAFSEQEIQELSDSIKTLGILQPILVRPVGDGNGYQIVAGERRYRAAGRAGLEEVPVIVRDLSDRETLEVALVENVQRQNLTAIEEARGYQRLIDEFNLTAQEVAEKVGKDRATVANIVRILKLPEVVQSMIAESRISLGHAKAILTVKEPAAQISLAKKVEDEHLSVRALEAIVSRVVVFDAPRKQGERSDSSSTERSAKRDSEARHPELEERLRNTLGTKVSIRSGKSGAGAIELHFFSDQELERLIELLSLIPT